VRRALSCAHETFLELHNYRYLLRTRRCLLGPLWRKHSPTNLAPSCRHSASRGGREGRGNLFPELRFPAEEWGHGMSCPHSGPDEGMPAGKARQGTCFVPTSEPRLSLRTCPACACSCVARGRVFTSHCRRLPRKEHQGAANSQGMAWRRLPRAATLRPGRRGGAGQPAVVE